MQHFSIAVVIEKRRLDNRWASEQWEAIGVVPAFGRDASAGLERIYADDAREQFLSGRFDLELFRDEAANYHLNLTSAEPRVFVLWRIPDEVACPVAVSLSYGEAARWLDSGEQCDGVPMLPEIADWLGDFVNTHFKPEPRKKIRRNDPFAAERQQ